MADDHTALSKQVLKDGEGHMGACANLLQKPVTVRLENRTAIPAHVRRSNRAGPPRPIEVVDRM